MAQAKVAAKTASWMASTDGGSTFTAVLGITDFSMSNSPTDADVTDFASGTATEHKVIRRAIEFTLNGFWLEDDATGAVSDGLEMLYDNGKGDTEIDYKLTTNGGSIISFKGTTVFTLSGDVNNVMTWSATIRATGAVTYTDA
jgi:hypothetical protein